VRTEYYRRTTIRTVPQVELELVILRQVEASTKAAARRAREHTRILKHPELVRTLEEALRLVETEIKERTAA
jgi:hypothetical protein